MKMSNLKPTIYRNFQENVGLSDVTIQLITLNIAMIMTMFS